MSGTVQELTTPDVNGKSDASERSESGELTMMKAAYYPRYGELEHVQIQDRPKPAVADDQVLVRVHAAALHVGDCFGVRGSPYLMRVATGWIQPKFGVPGFDLAGRVEAVGRGVKHIRIGDEVFGAGNATCAEYASVSESTLAPKPEGLSFEEAAALPTSGLAALHALRDVAKVEAGQQVLINGASGGVGSFAVQIAKAFGAEVTGVCSGTNVEFVRGLGADRVIDYHTEDFADGSTKYDLILDNIENRSLSDCRRALTPAGMLIVNSGTGATGLAMFVRLLHPLVLNPFTRQQLRRYLSMPKRADLLTLKELVEAGTLKPAIDRKYPLDQTVAALQHVDSGHARGKVVVSINPGA